MIPPRRSIRILLACLGLVALGIAVISLPVPGFPSSLFLLASLVLFARSSPGLEAWIRQHRVLGPWVKRVESRERWTLGGRLLAVALFWSGLLISWLLFRAQPVPGLEAMLLATAIVVAAIIFWK